MFSFRATEKAAYSRLDDTVENSTEHYFRLSNLSVWHRYSHIVSWMLSAFLFAISITMMVSSQMREMKLLGPLRTREYSKAVDECGARSSTKYVGEFDAPTIWRGSPNASIDAAWNSLDVETSTSISRVEMIRLGQLRDSSVELPDGQYLASLGVFHQIHCLNVIRKYTYLDYYVEHEREFFTAPTLRTHVDHCIDMLRQVLMCSADLHLITYDWVAEVDFPWPDFNGNRYCRDYTKVHDWATSHVTTSGSKTVVVPKPQGVALRPLPAHGH